MSRPVQVGDRAVITIENQSRDYLIREITPQGIYISFTGTGPLSLLKFDKIWKVDCFEQIHTVQFKPKREKSFFVSDRTVFKEDLEKQFPEVGNQFGCEMTQLPEWDQAHIVWKPISGGLNWGSMPNLEFFNNFFTTPDTLTKKLSLLETGKVTFGDKFFDLHPYSEELVPGMKIPNRLFPEGLGETAWITKPNGGFGGEGINIWWDPQGVHVTGGAHILQKYMERPLLYEGKKFDIRVLLLLTLDEIKIHSFMYARVSRAPYVWGTSDQKSNITNISLHGEYDSAVPLEKTGVTQSQVLEFIKRLKPLFQTVQQKEREFQERNQIKFHTFDLLGLDLIFDQTGRPWLLEVNKNPAFRSSRGGVYSQGPQFFSDTLKEAIFFRLFPQRQTTGYILI